MGPPNTGHKMKLYRNSNTYASPTWTEIAEIGDVSITDFTMGLAEMKRRANNFTKNLASLFQPIAVEFRLIHGLGATMYGLLRTDHFAGTPREYVVMDGSITTTGNTGLRIPAYLSQFPFDQPLEDVAGYDCRLDIAYLTSGSPAVEVDPIWYDVP